MAGINLTNEADEVKLNKTAHTMQLICMLCGQMFVHVGGIPLFGAISIGNGFHILH